MLYTLSLLFCLLSSFAQIDFMATVPTRKLYKKLETTSLSLKHRQQIILGQQNAFTQGRGWSLSRNESSDHLKSDMKEVSGVHPLMLGIDFQEIGNWNRDAIIELIHQVDYDGGMITLSWHTPTLINDGNGDNSFNDTTTKVVKHILPGGEAHFRFLQELDRLVSFFKSVESVPIIFRPFHEHNASWFWWGKDHCTQEEYVKLWRFVVSYLREKEVHNLLYAYSPSEVKEDYLERYPGDEYVDILGVDMYFFNKSYDVKIYGNDPITYWKKRILWLMNEATKRNKIPAITEFGQEGVEYDRFWTDYTSWPLERAGLEQVSKDLPERGIAYLMLWRNDNKNEKHFFGPLPGQKNNQNFSDLLSKDIFLLLEN